MNFVLSHSRSFLRRSLFDHAHDVAEQHRHHCIAVRGAAFTDRPMSRSVARAVVAKGCDGGRHEAPANSYEISVVYFDRPARAG